MKRNTRTQTLPAAAALSQPTPATPSRSPRPLRGHLCWTGGNDFEFIPDAPGHTGQALALTVEGRLRIETDRLAFHQVRPRTAPVHQPLVWHATEAVTIRQTRRYIDKVTRVWRRELTDGSTWADLDGALALHDAAARRIIQAQNTSLRYV